MTQTHHGSSCEDFVSAGGGDPSEFVSSFIKDLSLMNPDIGTKLLSEDLSGVLYLWVHDANKPSEVLYASSSLWRLIQLLSGHLYSELGDTTASVVWVFGENSCFFCPMFFSGLLICISAIQNHSPTFYISPVIYQTDLFFIFIFLLMMAGFLV